MQVAPALLSDARSAAAYAIFLASYFVFALGKFPGLKIDRPGAAIIGAVLMVAFRIVTAHEALRAIDFPTIVLLFSMTLIVAHRSARSASRSKLAASDNSRIRTSGKRVCRAMSRSLSAWLRYSPARDGSGSSGDL